MIRLFAVCNKQEMQIRICYNPAVLWIQIHWIWIRVQDFGPIWIRIQGYTINFERKIQNNFSEK